MDKDDKVNIQFGATIDDFQSKMSQVSGTFTQLATKWAALAAVVAGGISFKESIDQAIKFNEEALKIARAVDITANEAGILNTALNNISTTLGNGGISADAYTGAFLKFNRVLRTNSEDLRTLGIDVDAFNKGQMTSNELFMSAVKRVGEYKAGVDQTQVAMRLFGRSIEDVYGLLKLNDEALKDAEETNRSLNLTITQEGLEAAEAYKAAMNNVGDVLDGIQKTVGEAVIPMFTAMANSMASIGPIIVTILQDVLFTFVKVWQNMVDATEAAVSILQDILNVFGDIMDSVFRERAPKAMEVFRNVLRLVQVAFIEFRILVEIVSATVSGLIRSLGAVFVGFAGVVARALMGDFSGAMKAWENWGKNQISIVGETARKLVEIAKKGGQDIQDALVNPMGSDTKRTPAGKIPIPSGKLTAPSFDKDTGDTKKAELDLIKANNAAALALQLEYLRQAQAIYDNAYKNELITLKGYYAAKEAIDTQAFDFTIAAKRQEVASVQEARSAQGLKASERIQFQVQEAKLLGEINILEAQRVEMIRKNGADYANAESARMIAIQSMQNNARKAAAEAGIEDDRRFLSQQFSLRRINAEELLRLEAALEQSSYTITKEALDAKLQLAQNDALKRKEIRFEMETAEREHQQRLVAIERQATLEKRRYALQAQGEVQNSFAVMLNEFMSGTVSLGNVLRNFAMRIATTFQNLIAQRFAERIFGAGTAGNALIDRIVAPFVTIVDRIVGKWILGQSSMTAATVVGATTRTAAETAASSASMASTAATAIANIGAKAWEAAAAVYASIAAIPYIGPFLAPAMAVAAGAMVMGFVGRIASAKDGWWQVPGDQIANIHKDEMVMPAPEAQGIRDLVKSGGVKGGASEIHIHAVDAASVRKLFMDNGPALMASIKRQGRGFAT
jgi:hypothetical protein